MGELCHSFAEMYCTFYVVSFKTSTVSGNDSNGETVQMASSGFGTWQ